MEIKFNNFRKMIWLISEQLKSSNLFKIFIIIGVKSSLVNHKIGVKFLINSMIKKSSYSCIKIFNKSIILF